MSNTVQQHQYRILEYVRLLILDFFKTSANLKNIPRQGWIDKLNHKNPETVAEHVYMTAVMGMVISDLEGKNTEKILKMILLHDLAESLVGDITPDRLSRESKADLENNAMRKILDELPPSLSEEYRRLWSEFQQNSSEESRLIHQVDKLEMALQARIYSKSDFKPEQVATFFKTAKDEITEKNIKEILENILEGR